MTISGCGETYDIVTDIKLKPINTCLANYSTPLTDRVEDPETPTPINAIFNINNVDLHQHQP